MQQSQRNRARGRRRGSSRLGTLTLLGIKTCDGDVSASQQENHSRQGPPALAQHQPKKPCCPLNRPPHAGHPAVRAPGSAHTPKRALKKHGAGVGGRGRRRCCRDVTASPRSAYTTRPGEGRLGCTRNRSTVECPWLLAGMAPLHIGPQRMAGPVPAMRASHPPAQGEGPGPPGRESGKSLVCAISLTPCLAPCLCHCRQPGGCLGQPVGVCGVLK